jgi:hypothetical protein
MGQIWVAAYNKIIAIRSHQTKLDIASVLLLQEREHAAQMQIVAIRKSVIHQIRVLDRMYVSTLAHNRERHAAEIIPAVQYILMTRILVSARKENAVFVNYRGKHAHRIPIAAAVLINACRTRMEGKLAPTHQHVRDKKRKDKMAVRERAIMVALKQQIAKLDSHVFVVEEAKTYLSAHASLKYPKAVTAKALI